MLIIINYLLTIDLLFFSVGLADYDGIAQFHLPKNDDYVSGSIDAWDGVKEETIEAEVKKTKNHNG